jgi:hypothetical protein
VFWFKNEVGTHIQEPENNMDDTLIVTAYTVTDDVLKALGYEDHCLAKLGAAEIITVAVVAARYFNNNHERALCVMHGMKYLKHSFSPSRYNRRLHKLYDWLMAVLSILGDVFKRAAVFIIDSMPVPVCHRRRARRCQKVRGRVFLGYCPAKDDYYFGWKLHLVCTPQGIPVAFALLPASLHDLTPIHELTAVLPSGACVVADKGYNSINDELSIFVESGVRLVPRRRKNMSGNSTKDRTLLRQHRSVIETVNSQLEKMGLQRLHARTHLGFELKIHSSLLALTFANTT